MKNRGPEALRELEALLGPDAVSRDPTTCLAYAHDETEDFSFEPDAVIRPKTTTDVCTVLRLASREGVPVTPRGGGTGLSGGALPVCGGILLSLERLDAIRRFDITNQLIEVEAGVVTASIQREAEKKGLFYPPDPASSETCCIGGNIAEDSAGPRSCKYGSTRKWVLGLEVVLANGELIETGGENRKDVAGYDLTQLLIGSEGTLAVVTAAKLRLIPQPAARVSIALTFSSLEAAADAVAEIFSRGHDPAACEILERGALEGVSRIEQIPSSMEHINALLLVELDGRSQDSLIERANHLRSDLLGSLAGEPSVAIDARQQRRLWRIRDRVGEAVKQGCIYKEVDAVVPRSALAKLVSVAREAAQVNGLEAICYGHAGDGNLHVNLLRRRLSSDDWTSRRDAAERQLCEGVAALGGSITGEHGVGWTQRQHLALVRSPTTIDLMRRIKEAFDPQGIMNPAKIFPDPEVP